MFFGNAAWKQLFMGLVQTLTEGMDITYLEEESEEQISIDYDLDEDEKKIMLGKTMGYLWTKFPNEYFQWNILLQYANPPPPQVALIFNVWPLKRNADSVEI